MSNSIVGNETRQSMIRVWMAISAVWVAFWLLIAVMVLATVGWNVTLAEDFRTFSLILLLPPFVVLLLGVLYGVASGALGGRAAPARKVCQSGLQEARTSS